MRCLCVCVCVCVYVCVCVCVCVRYRPTHHHHHHRSSITARAPHTTHQVAPPPPHCPSQSAHSRQRPHAGKHKVRAHTHAHTHALVSLLQCTAPVLSRHFAVQAVSCLSVRVCCVSVCVCVCVCVCVSCPQAHPAQTRALRPQPGVTRETHTRTWLTQGMTTGQADRRTEMHRKSERGTRRTGHLAGTCVCVRVCVCVCAHRAVGSTRAWKHSCAL